ncbi:MAG: leucyl aminopeptidase [Gammaproteobacteria bacterium]|nr:leucyl aminopeptidase [Gammaproteobacteria bacterium]|tara:strand:- start:1664 stop:3151 length:1488 start_codon:yes stop_codon:yes gene_type:complete
MRYSVKVDPPDKINADCVVVPIWNKAVLSDEAKIIDAASAKAISKILHFKDFSGKLGETQLIYNPINVKAKRILLVGAGNKNKLDAKAAVKLISSTLNLIRNSKASSIHLALSSLVVKNRNSTWLAARISQESEIASYQYDATKSTKAKAYAIKSISLNILNGGRRKSIESALKCGQIIGKAVNHARELGNLPGNICTPTYLARHASSLASRHRSVTTQVLSEKQMARLGMGSLLSVGNGSAEESKLIVIQYKGAKSNSAPFALVGKGITFDTGGISLKPGAAMDEMKFDMCGAASVVATMGAVADLKLPINVVGVVAAAENMPSDRATKPGDIVTSMSGKTIEILNTDAEGRLVLCDALTYVEKFKPRSVIDVATLTGAAVATFGSHANALLSNNEKLANTLMQCGEYVLDRAWQLPLWDEYQSLLNSNFADVANIGGPRAGTITAACFLSRFTERQKWAHLDIAGSAWHSGSRKGATGRPVPLLVEYLSRQKA